MCVCCGVSLPKVTVYIFVTIETIREIEVLDPVPLVCTPYSRLCIGSQLISILHTAGCALGVN